MRNIISLIMIVILAGAVQAKCCTTFAFKDKSRNSMMFGRNFDRDKMGDALVVVNPKGVYKKALTSGVPAEWTSQYGSVTFNQYGVYFPIGGMNDKGLVVEVMILPGGSTYIPYKNMTSVNISQWVQYQLDNYKSVEEVIRNVKTLNIRDLWGTPLHYLVCDENSCASIEFIDNKVVIRTGKTLGVDVKGSFIPVRALSNSSYNSSLSELKKYSTFGGSKPLPTEPSFISEQKSGSVQRFVRAAVKARELENSSAKGNISVDKVFDALDFFTQINKETKFQIVYDIKNREISWQNVYKASESNRVEKTKTQSVSLNSLNLQCPGKLMVKNMQDPSDHKLDSDLRDILNNRFIPYNERFNRELVIEADAKEIKMINFAEKFLVGGGLVSKDFYNTAENPDLWWTVNFLQPLWFKYPDKFTFKKYPRCISDWGF